MIQRSIDAAELEVFRKELRSYVAERVTPHAAEWEGRREFPPSLLPELAERGWLGLTAAAEVGGRERSLWHHVVMAEEFVASGMLGLGLSLALHEIVCVPCLNDLGRSVPEIATCLRRAIRGEEILGLALTEPEGGSSLRSRSTIAERVGGGYRLDGEKIFITNAPIADALLVLAATEPEREHRGLSLVFVPTDTPGLEVVEEMKLLGLHTSPTGRVVLRDCQVPEEFLLGQPNVAAHYVQKYAGYERLLGGIACTAYAHMLLEHTRQRLRERRVDGEPLWRRSAVRQRWAELLSRATACRELGYFAVGRLVAGRRGSAEIAMTKLLGSELVQEVAGACGQWFGGYGFLDDHLLARAARDVRMTTVGGGPSEVMKEIVAAKPGPPTV